VAYLTANRSEGIHLLIAKNGSKHKIDTRKSRGCANNNHSWFRL